MRVDFNLPIVKNRVQDDFRIKKVLPSIEQLSKNGNRIILISHLNVNGQHPSLKKVAALIKKKYLKNLAFVPDLTGKKAEEKISGLKPGEIVLLENLRSCPAEKKNDKNFAKKIASFADIYINEAFSASHRRHASIVGIPKYLPSRLGELFKKEVKNLSRAFNPPRPFLLILGGKKLQTKLPLIKKFVGRADFIAIGGKLVNEFIGRSTPNNLILPADVTIIKNKKRKIVKLKDVNKKDDIVDIGPQAISAVKNLISKSKFVLWNGPLGWIEGGFDESTKQLAAALTRPKFRQSKKAVVGGGDTVGYLDKRKLTPKFYFVSTGGGAMLEFLAKGTLPGIKAVAK